MSPSKPLLPPAARELLDRALIAHVSTVSPAGRPQAGIVWFERRDDSVVFFSEATTPKVRNLRENPRIDLIVVDPERDLGAGTPCYLRLTGTAELRQEEPGFVDHLARRYGHAGGYPASYGKLGEVVTIHVDVRRVSGYGPFGGADSWVQ